MIKIAHRGNLNGPHPAFENSPLYIEKALSFGVDCEIDVWVDLNNEIYLGHNEPQYQVQLNWLLKNSTKLWIHCKNSKALMFFNSIEGEVNFFWHENDEFTLTSKGYIWVYPKSEPVFDAICVLPERFDNDWLNRDYSGVKGICTDYLESLKK
jgi:hypothetical protein